MCETNPKRQCLEGENKEAESFTSSMTWDVDPVRKSFVYADLEVEEIEWNDDEDTPTACHSPDMCKHNSDPRRRKSKKRNSEAKKDAVQKISKNTSINAFIQQKNSCDNFSNLLDEIILKIFGFLSEKSLSRCVRVCKNWMRLGYDESFWKKVDLSNSALSPGVLGSILHRGVVELKLKRTNVLGPLCLETCPYKRCHKKNLRVAKHGCGLFSLKLLDASGYKFEKNGILPLIQKCKNLETIILKGSVLNQDEIRAIADNPILQNLNLSMCEGITSDALTLLSKKCNRLKALNIGWTNLNSDECNLVTAGCSTTYGAHHYQPGPPWSKYNSTYRNRIKLYIIDTPIAKLFTGLRELDISGMKNAMTDEVVQKLTCQCKDLSIIDLSDSPLIGSASVDAIVAHNSFKKIAISRCYNIPATKLSSIANIESLEDLQLFGFIQQETITELKRLRPNLRINSEFFSTIATPETQNNFLSR